MSQVVIINDVYKKIGKPSVMRKRKVNCIGMGKKVKRKT